MAQPRTASNYFTFYIYSSKPLPSETQAYSLSPTVHLSIKLQHQGLLRFWVDLFCLLFICEGFFLFGGGSLVGIFCFLLVLGLLFFLKKKCQCSLVSWSIWRTGAGSFKAPEIGEAQSITEFSFCSISITEPLVVSLVTSNTCC